MEMDSINDIVLLCGNSNVKLAKDIAKCLKLPLNEQNIPSQFANTEIRSKILDDLNNLVEVSDFISRDRYDTIKKIFERNK